jgi:hypothetical protein
MAKVEGTEAAAGGDRFAGRSERAAADGAPALDDRLAHCRGFQVESADGRLGSVVDTLLAADDRPRGVVVRVGLFRKRVVFVSAEAVTAVQPDQRRVVIATAGGKSHPPGDTNGLEGLSSSADGRC